MRSISRQPALNQINSCLKLLSGGDWRSIGRSDEVVGMVLQNPRVFRSLIAGLCSEDRMVRMRAADAAEKVSCEKPQVLSRYKKELLGLMAEAQEPELRWHLAIMVPRLPLAPKECQLAASWLSRYLEDRSSIVKTMAMQGLFDLSRVEPTLRANVMEILRQAGRTGTAAMKARSRKLLRQLNQA